MADGVVQVPPDSTGKKVDTSELTRPDTVVVERQRVSIGDPTTFANQATVTAAGALKVDGSAVTQPASIAGTVTVAGTVTSNQGGAPWAENITQIGGSALAFGQAAMASSIPVVLASNQAAIPVSQSGSWAVQANAGTNLNTSLLALDTSVNGILLGQGSTTSGQKGPMVLAAVTTSAPSYTTAQTSPLSLDTAGNLRVSLQASGVTVTVSGTVTANQGGAPWADNVTQFGGTNISTGTGAGGAGIPRVTVSNDSNVLATQSGSWTVQANAGTNLNTSALALDTSVNGLLLAQASTTSGQKGPLVFGAVTTNAPAYTTAQSDPLSLDTSGLLRISIKDTPSNSNNLNINLAASAATVTVSATNLSTNVAQFGGTNVVTGTGASAAGVPRVTVSNDSNVLVTQSTSPWVENVSQFGGNNVVTGTGSSGVGIPRVTVSNDSTVVANQGTAGLFQPWIVNLTQVGGTPITTVPASIAAGADVTEGNTTDAQVLPGAAGTISGKLAAISQTLAGAQVEILTLILTELRLINQVLATGLNVNDDLDVWRQDRSLASVN